MIPIQDLLHRIRWAPAFAEAEFMIGYFDRVANRIVRVPFKRIHLERGEHFSFDVIDEEGVACMVPFHRVREVWRDGVLIGQRTHAEPRAPR